LEGDLQGAERHHRRRPYQAGGTSACRAAYGYGGGWSRTMGQTAWSPRSASPTLQAHGVLRRSLIEHQPVRNSGQIGRASADISSESAFHLDVVALVIFLIRFDEIEDSFDESHLRAAGSLYPRVTR